jgi:hypothetical protein
MTLGIVSLSYSTQVKTISSAHAAGVCGLSIRRKKEALIPEKSA